MSNQVNSMNKGLTVKDLVTTGIFTALLFVFVLVGGVFFATNPVLTFFMPAGGGLLAGPIYLLLIAKVHKRWSLSIMGIIMGIIWFVTGMHWAFALGYQQSFSPSYTIRRWRLGIYIRLSKEDLKKGKDDSNSVKNQRDLLNDFYRRNIDEFESITEYVDDGHTGTDANREDFQRLLADVMSGKINCVIVKDLSRFARNYSDAGSLIDNLFVQMGVRFISLAENVDSYKNPDSVSNIIVPITNVMNDNYCYQTSKKIRQVFDYKRRNGQYIGAFAPYGYVKHPKDKHRLIVDPDAA